MRRQLDPIALPAVLARAVVTSRTAIVLFGLPALIAIPARFNVVITLLLQFFRHPLHTEVAAARAVPMLLVAVALFGLQR